MDDVSCTVRVVAEGARRVGTAKAIRHQTDLL
jgi:hypothetical protein